MSQALEKILEEVKTLSEEDRHQLAAMLHEINGSARASAGEHGFESKLAAEGWLTLPVAPASESAPFQLAAPFTVLGRPLSEILIEERR